jgi:ectoine hydroxylase-related dioxygenase (phytanoyl-CoA dioxygenase family)
MVTAEDKKFFDENGYLLIRNVLTPDEITFLRKRALEIFSSDEWKVSSYNTNRTVIDTYRYFPEIMRVSLGKKVVDTVKALLGSDDIILTPETAMMTGFYPTWHKDTTTQEKLGHSFHKSPDFKMVRCGIYMQDNDEYGGGLSVISGSHRKPDNFLTGDFLPKRTLWYRIKNRLMPQKEEDNVKLNPHKLKIVDIPSKVGDLVFFNFQTAHKGTIPKSQRIGDVPAHKSKIAIFDTFGVNNEQTKMYVDFLKTRPENIYGFARDRHQSAEFDEYTRSIGLGAL